jgi:hypothetical protein
MLLIRDFAHDFNISPLRDSGFLPPYHIESGAWEISPIVAIRMKTDPKAKSHRNRHIPYGLRRAFAIFHSRHPDPTSAIIGVANENEVNL